MNRFGALGALAVCFCLAIGSGGSSQSAQAAAHTSAPGETFSAAPDLSAALSALSIADRQSNTAAKPAVRAVAGALARRIEPHLAAPTTSPPPGVRLSALGGLLDAADLEAVLIPYGVAGRNGRLSTGVTAATAPGGVVFAPIAGEIGFAGPLDGYGAVVIVVTGPNTALILTGLAETIVRKGDKVRIGAALGRMADPNASSTGHGLTNPATQTPELYIEVRDQGQYIDPLPWFAAHR